MKNKSSGRSLYGLLARNYLLFTLTLLLIAGGLYYFWNMQINRLYQPVELDRLLADPGLESGDYERLEKYIYGEGFAFAVLDERGQVLYSTDPRLDSPMTAGELACLPKYDDQTYCTGSQFTDVDGVQFFAVTQYAYDSSADTYTEAAHMVLDGNYRVVSGGLGDGRTEYTQREYRFLTDSSLPGYDLFRQSVTADDGSRNTLLLCMASIDSGTLNKEYDSLWRIWLLFVPMYLLATGMFIWWLNRRIRIPLEKLNSAVLAKTEGRAVRASDCGGTGEMRRIGESFDLLSERLEVSENERRALDEGRQKLIADISHDLKTPITVISGYAGAICDGRVPPEKEKQYLNAIRQKSEELTELIDAFHEYSKVEHPEFSLKLERTDICEFSREYLAKKYDEIDLAGFSLDISIPEEPIFCELDEFQFRRVLDNLISNSVRYNRLGTILFFDVARSRTAVTVRIADNGVGIPPERRESIFEPFVVGSDARNSGGSGLGLAITKRIVEKHGGAIFLSQAPAAGRSSEFVIKLPVA